MHAKQIFYSKLLKSISPTLCYLLLCYCFCPCVTFNYVNNCLLVKQIALSLLFEGPYVIAYTKSMVLLCVSSNSLGLYQAMEKRDQVSSLFFIGSEKHAIDFSVFFDFFFIPMLSNRRFRVFRWPTRDVPLWSDLESTSALLALALQVLAAQVARTVLAPDVRQVNVSLRTLGLLALAALLVALAGSGVMVTAAGPGWVGLVVLWTHHW